MTRPIPLPDYAAKALAEGRLRQVRVRLKPQPEMGENGYLVWKVAPGVAIPLKIDWWLEENLPLVAGERHWVQESWQYADWTEEGEPYVRYKADGEKKLLFVPIEQAMAVEDAWIALSEARHNRGGKLAEDTRWRSPVTMPEWASRWDLVVESVRVERAWCATEQDAEDEGAPPVLVPPDGGSCPHLVGLEEHWRKRHGPGSWERDWCCVARVRVERRGAGR